VFVRWFPAYQIVFRSPSRGWGISPNCSPIPAMVRRSCQYLQSSLIMDRVFNILTPICLWDNYAQMSCPRPKMVII
jgi:hypothetical protein